MPKISTKAKKVTAKVVRVAGPYGTSYRYKNIETGLFVRKPRGI